MKVRKALVRIAVVAVAASSLLLLDACSKKPTSGEGSDAGYSDTSGMASNGYDTDSSGFKVNSLKAPSNQTYYFEFNSSDVRQVDMKALLIQANYMAAHSTASVRLEGNTDDRGSREYNIGLGWRRDQSVARILEQQGVRPNQIQMVSYGKENPAVPGDNEHAWALDRRVDFVYKDRA